MADIKVNSERLHASSQRLASGAEAIQTQLTDMESEVRALVDADWQSAASQAFTDLWANWQSSATQLRESLEGVSQLLSSSARGYEEREEANAASFRQ